MSTERITLKEINKLAIPAIMAGIAEPLIALADTAIVGHLGTVELAAVGLGSSLFLLFVWGFSSMKSAVSALVAKYYGQNNIEGIKTLVPQAIAMAFIIGLVLLVSTLYFAKELFVLHNAAGEVLTYSLKYYNIRALGYPFTLATFTVFGVFRGCQNTSHAMWISLIGGAVNIILDFALIYGTPLNHAMGVEGAAYATLAAQVVMLSLSLIMLEWKYSYSYQIVAKLNKEFSNLLVMAGNLILRTLALNVAYYLGNRFSTGYGKDHIAAHTIAMNIWLFSAFFIDGYANAGNAIAGKLLGQGDRKELRSVGLKITKISVLIGALLGTFYLALYVWMGSFFTDQKSVIVIFNSIFFLVILSQPINGVAFALDGIFKGLGRTALLRNVLISGTAIVFIPVIYGLDYLGLNMLAVWLAFTFWMVYRAGSLLIVFLKDFKHQSS